MLDVAALMDRARTRHHLRSDYALAKVSGLYLSSLGRYRSGKGLPDAAALIALAKLSGDDPAQLVALCEAERAQSDDVRMLWLSMADRLGSLFTAPLPKVSTQARKVHQHAFAGPRAVHAH